MKKPTLWPARSSVVSGADLIDGKRIHYVPVSMVNVDGYFLRFNKSASSANGL
jgi:hypothetical protein